MEFNDGSRGTRKPVFRLKHTMAGLLLHEETYDTSRQAHEALRDIVNRLATDSLRGKHEVAIFEDYIQWSMHVKGEDKVANWTLYPAEGEEVDGEEDWEGDPDPAFDPACLFASPFNEKVIDIAQHYAKRRDAQYLYLMMECGELVDAMGKFQLGGDGEAEYKALLGELADVWIMMAQIVFYLDESRDASDELKKMVEFKLDRQIKRIREEGR